MMKDFGYYTKVDIPLPNFMDIKKGLIQKIDDTPMTKDQREEALKGVAKQANAIYDEAAKPHNDAMDALSREFWQDCREDLGYEKYLDKEGVAALEYAAYERGHAYGFSDIYSCLCDLDELANKLKGHYIKE